MAQGAGKRELKVYTVHPGRSGTEGDTVIGTNGVRQTELLEGSFKDGERIVFLGGIQCITGE